jgi:hypothetical protein
MSDNASEKPSRVGAAILWPAAYVIGLFGAGIFARVVDLNPFWSMAIMVPPMLLLIPMIRSVQKRFRQAGLTVPPAIAIYSQRMLIFSFTYMAALFGAVTVYHQFKPTGPTLWFIAVVPAVPIMFFVWTFGRYLVEETDEYMRMRQVSATLLATGWLLVMATIWGFLETFGVAIHVPGWAAVPVWAIGLGVIQIWRVARGI